MGILNRFKDIMASNIYAITSREDKHPEKTIEKYLGQLRTDLGQVKSETDALRLEYQRAKRALDENLSEQEKLERYIEKANAAGNSADARVFETKLDKVKLDGATLKQKYDNVEQNMTALSKMNEKLGSDISTLEARLSEIKYKMENAKAQEEMNKMAKKAGAANGDELLSKMNEKADYALDKANAMAELEKGPVYTDFSEVESLAAKYDDSSDSETDGLIDIKGPDDEE